ncbi:CBU_0592 family membrane protein [Hyphococcus sp.]|uniref:CBU_0592 family membrane protein n=1 Tax=Hyphococcus sp. TaxID=2038636 RepID=UPI003CCBB94A
MMLTIVGWVSTAIYLGNHGYLSTHRNYRPNIYYALNFIGASGIVVSSAAIASWQAVVVNVFWAGLSLLALSGTALPESMRLSERWILTPLAILGAGGLAYGFADFPAGMAALGWAATGLFSGGYLLFAAGAVRRRRFLLYNIFAAYGLVPILYLDANWPVLALELAWGTISIAGWVAAIRNPPQEHY